MSSTSKSRFPNGTNVYVQEGSTEFKIASSTGALYHQGTILPVAPVGAAVAATLTNKTIGSAAAFQVFEDTTASAAISGYGLHIFTATTAPQAYELPLPAAGGIPLWLYTKTANSSDTITVATTASNLINGCEDTILITTPGTLVKLISLGSTMGWAVEWLGSTLASTGTTTLPTITS
jgi:hypothetical protein